MKRLFCIVFLVYYVVALPQDRKHVTPQFLDQLLMEERYDEFNSYMGVDIPDISVPEEEQRHDMMFNKDLFQGDILLTPEQREKSRQGIDIISLPQYRWPGNPALVYYYIATNYTEEQRGKLLDAIAHFNDIFKCIKFVDFDPYTSQIEDFVFIFPGRGCYASIGMTGGAQYMSIGTYCIIARAAIIHEFYHAAGFIHEHARSDRDTYIKILWNNINETLWDQYVKHEKNFKIYGDYDYYSIMHYQVLAPDSDKPAFKVLQEGIDESKIGMSRSKVETAIDVQKMNRMYC